MLSDLRTLVVGAGGVGGYFGGRLLEAKRDVTFLVRPARAAQLQRTGLAIRSRLGDLDIANPPTVLSGEMREHFDLILLTTKAYDLEEVLRSFAPAVGPDTMILPLLNGVRHIGALVSVFGDKPVLDGECVISVTQGAAGEIIDLDDVHHLTFGELNGARTERVDRVASTFAGARFDSAVSSNILQDMWNKWVFIATAGMTCLMRGVIGDIVAAGGSHLCEGLLRECADIAKAEGHAMDNETLSKQRATFTMPGSTLTSSMLRDIEHRNRIEADHIIGDLLSRGVAKSMSSPLLGTVFTHLKTYEAGHLHRKSREVHND